jgi:predicted phosphodiesterase
MRGPVNAILLMVLSAYFHATARDAAGLLSVIITPNEGVPAIVTPGQTFDAVLTAQGDLALLQDETRVPLAVEWQPLPGSRHRARCTVPADTAPGAYAIAVQSGGVADTLIRAVWVVQSFPEVYAIAHLSDTHIGSDRHPRPSTDILHDMIQHVNAGPAAFVAITGDLTDGGQPEQFQQFLAILNECTKPTFVCPGNHDRQASNYEAAMGPLTYWFTFGADAFLVFDTQDYRVADELGRQDALLERYRQAMMPSRWRIGLTHRFEPDQGMRSQLILFADHRLDHLFYGHWHRENKSNAEAMPWPDVPATVTPAAINGAMRIVKIGRATEGEGIQPGPVEKVVVVTGANPEP